LYGHTTRVARVPEKLPQWKERAKFQVFTMAGMEMAAFWDIAPCSLVEVDRRFRSAYCHHQSDEYTASEKFSRNIEIGWAK
jgi:hypothetical protein